MKGAFKVPDYSWNSGDNDYRVTTDPSSDNSYFYFLDGKEICKFHYAYMDGQCGCAHLCHWSWEVNLSDKSWQAPFLEDLKTFFKGEVAKVFTTATSPDSLGDRQERSSDVLWDFLHNGGWQTGTVTKNPNSGNKIALFEMDVA